MNSKAKPKRTSKHVVPPIVQGHVVNCRATTAETLDKDHQAGPFPLVERGSNDCKIQIGDDRCEIASAIDESRRGDRRQLW